MTEMSESTALRTENQSSKTILCRISTFVCVLADEFINTGLLNSSFSFFFDKFDKVHFDGYDRRYGDDGIHERLQWEDNEVRETSTVLK